jgi:hypothetical protein
MGNATKRKGRIGIFSQVHQEFKVTRLKNNLEMISPKRGGGTRKADKVIISSFFMFPISMLAL